MEQKMSIKDGDILLLSGEILPGTCKRLMDEFKKADINIKILGIPSNTGVSIIEHET